MIDSLIDFDKELTIILNQLWHPFLDDAMIFASNKYVWIPLYIAIIVFTFILYGKNGFWIIFFGVIAILLADQITSSFMKPFFERLRPCHNPNLDGIIIVPSSCGGKFGFASSHAANTAALALFFSYFKKLHYGPFLMIWAIAISYSRIYLGVHYAGDIVIGWTVGVLSALISIILFSQSKRLLFKAG